MLNAWTVAWPNKLASQLTEYWKDKISVKLFTLTSRHTCSEQSPVVADKLKVKASPMSIEVSTGSCSTTQATAIFPLWNSAFTKSLLLSKISIDKGVSENCTIELPGISPMASKQSWYKTASAGKVTPETVASVQPTLINPSVSVLKFAAPRPAKLNPWTVAFPNTAASQLIEYWKDTISWKFCVVTSTQICSPQLRVASAIVNCNGEGLGLVVVSTGSSTISQVMVATPFWKVGAKILPATSTTSIAKGVSEKSISNVPEALSTTSKHKSNNTWLSGTVIPAKVASSQPTRTIPAVFVLKLASESPSKLKFCTVATPKVSAL